MTTTTNTETTIDKNLARALQALLTEHGTEKVFDVLVQASSMYQTCAETHQDELRAVEATKKLDAAGKAHVALEKRVGDGRTLGDAIDILLDVIAESEASSDAETAAALDEAFGR